MAKDIAKLRREEVEKERKRIANIKVEQAKEKEEPQLPAMDKAQISLAPEAKTPNISAPKPLSQKQKVIIRVVIGLIFIFLLVNAGLFLYWYFTRDGTSQEAPEQTTPVVQEPAPTTQQQPVVQEPTPPLMPTEGAISLSVAKENLLPELSQLMGEERTQGFTKINLQDSWSIADVFEAMGITDSQSIGEGIEEILVFIHQGAQKRIGLVAKLKAPVDLSSWETTLELDTAPLFAIIGNKDSGYTSQFRSTAHQNIPVRFQTFSLQDLGIVYATTNDYLILTSSFESIKAVINILNPQ